MKKTDKKIKRAALRRDIKDHKVLFVVYLIMRLTVIAIMIPEIFNRNYNNVFLCVLTLVLFMIPSFVEKKIKIDIPDFLEVIILFFIFAAEILGELQEYYLAAPYWDTVLHTINGFLCAAIGLALIDILNGSDKVAINLSPIFAAVCAFCFSMTIGVIWEFFEFFMDIVFRSDMQKDTILTTVSSVLLNPEGKNIAETIAVDSLTLNGMTFSGYIDIGLFYVRKNGNMKLINHILPRKIRDKESKNKENIQNNK